MGLAIYEKEPNITWVNYKFIEQRIDAQYYKREFVENEIKLKQIKNLPLKELYTRGDYGTLPDSADYSEKGIYLIRGTDLRDLSIKEDDLILVPEEYFSDKSEVKSEDILILIKGATIDAEWSVSIVPKINYKAIFNGSIFRIRLKKEYDPYFVTAFMSTKYFLYQKKRAISNTGIYYNDKESIENFIISIPSPEIQKYIGDKVRKAEELREEAKKLKKEAEEILNNELNVKELLIKIDRYTEKHSWIMNSDINDRMDALYYNPQKITIKKFYKNYNLQKLKDLVDYKKGYAFKSEDYCNNTSTFLLRVSDISNNEVDMCNMLNLPDEFYQEYKDFNLINGDIVMVVTGNTTGKSIVINNNKFKLLLNQNAIRMRIKEGIDISPYYIELILQSQYFQTLLKYSLYQSVQPFISMEFLNDVVIPIIDKTKLENISNLYEKSLNNLFYAKQLIEEAKQDVEDLIEGNFDMSKVKANS